MFKLQTNSCKRRIHHQDGFFSDVSSGFRHQADNADHQVASAHIDEPKRDNMAGIARCDEESSDDALGRNSEP